MRIRFDCTVNDFAAFSRYHYAQSLQQRKTRRLQYFAMPALIFAVFVIIAFQQEALVPLVIGVVVYGAILSWLLKRGEGMYLDAVEKQMRLVVSEGENAAVFGPRELEITPDYLIERSPVHEHILRWTAVEKIVETWNYGFIYWCGFSAIMVRKAAISKDEFRAFFDAANHALKAARPDIGVPPPIPESQSPKDLARL